MWDKLTKFWSICPNFFFITSKFGTNWPKDGQFVPTFLFVTTITLTLTLNKTLTLNPKTHILNPNPKARNPNPKP